MLGFIRLLLIVRPKPYASALELDPPERPFCSCFARASVVDLCGQTPPSNSASSPWSSFQSAATTSRASRSRSLQVRRLPRPQKPRDVQEAVEGLSSFGHLEGGEEIVLTHLGQG